MCINSGADAFANPTKDIHNQLQISILNLVFTAQVKGAETLTYGKMNYSLKLYF